MHTESIIGEFGEGIPDDFAIEWLKLKTPDDFGPEYRAVGEEMKAKEAALLNNAKEQLLKTMNSEQVDKILIQLPTFWGGNLFSEGLKTGTMEEILKNIFLRAADSSKLKRFARINTFIQDLSTFTRKDLPELRKKVHDYVEASQIALRTKYLQKLTPEAIKEAEARLAARAKEQGRPPPTLTTDNEKIVALSFIDQVNYSKEMRAIASVEVSLFNQLEAALQFDTLAKETGMTTFDQRLSLLRVKEEYDNKLEDLGRELMFGDLGIDIFKRQTHGLPSRACEDARRLKFNEPYLETPQKVLIQILLQLGVLRREPLIV